MGITLLYRAEQSQSNLRNEPHNQKEMTRMLELENLKCLAYFGSAVIAKIGSEVASVAANSDEFSKWIERGGTGLSIVLLLMGLRYMRAKLEDREKRLDAIMDKDREIHEKATEARLQLSATMEKQATAIDGLTRAIDKK